MALFEWNDSLSVGVAAMDTQHKRLVSLVNRIYEAMRQSEGHQVVHSILQELANYTLTHFAAEEDLMRKAQYPHLDAHIALHKVMIDKVMRMLNDVKSGKKVAAVSLATFLKDWLTNHIQNTDRKYGLYLHNQIHCHV